MPNSQGVGSGKARSSAQRLSAAQSQPNLILAIVGGSPIAPEGQVPVAMGKRPWERGPWLAVTGGCAAKRYVSGHLCEAVQLWICTHRSAAHSSCRIDPWAALASSLTHGYAHLPLRGRTRKLLTPRDL